MLDPKTITELGKIHQQELIELGQRVAPRRQAEPRGERQIVTLLRFLRDGLKHEKQPEMSNEVRTERRNYHHV